MKDAKLKALNKYLALMQAKLDDFIPIKHKHRPVEYMAYIRNEIRKTKAKIDALVMEATK